MNERLWGAKLPPWVSALSAETAIFTITDRPLLIALFRLLWGLMRPVIAAKLPCYRD